MARMASDELSARMEREIVATFRRHRALSGPAALRLRDLGLQGNPVLKGLVNRSVIRRAGPERYYLHEQSLALQSKSMSNAVWIALGVVIAGIAIVFFLMTRG